MLRSLVRFPLSFAAARADHATVTYCALRQQSKMLKVRHTRASMFVLRIQRRVGSMQTQTGRVCEKTYLTMREELLHGSYDGRPWLGVNKSRMRSLVDLEKKKKASTNRGHVEADRE